MLFIYTVNHNTLFYYVYCGSIIFAVSYGVNCYSEYRHLKENINLFIPNQNNTQPHEPLNKPLEMEVEDLPLKACLYYRNGYSFKQICGKMRLGREPQTAKRLVIKGLHILLNEHNQKEVIKIC